MAITWPKATDDASLATGAARRTAQERLSCLARNGGARGSPCGLPDGVGAGRGRKSRGVVAAQAVEASAVLRADQPIEEAVWSALGTDWQRRRWRPTRRQRIATSFIGIAHALQAPDPAHLQRPRHRPRCRPATDWSDLPCGIDRTESKATNEAEPGLPIA